MQASARPHTRWLPIALTVLVGAIATAVAFLGTREPTQPPPSLPVVPVEAIPVHAIALPYDEPELPAGPHQRTFVISCTICHSTRLVMTQPPLAQKQWTEVVHKMVKTYGAPITPEQEEQIVSYLTTIKGK